MSNEKFNPSTTYQLVKQKRKGPKTKDISAKRYSKMLKRFRKKGSSTTTVSDLKRSGPFAREKSISVTEKPNSKKTIAKTSYGPLAPFAPMNVRR